MASITTIQGTDSLRDTRATINQNFTNINNELTTITGLSGIPGPTGPAGPTGAMGTGITWRSLWNNATSYSTNDAVTYNGVAWVAVASSTNIAPGTDGTKWQAYIDFSSVTASSITRGVAASRPNQPTSPNIGYLGTDDVYLHQSDGSTWRSFGPMFPLTPLDDSSWSWLNQGSATMTTIGSTRLLTAPGNSGDSLRCRIRSVPSTPYTITALFLADLYPSNYVSNGIVLYNSGNGRLISFGYGINNGYTYAWHNWNNTTSWNSTPVGHLSLLSPYTFFRITDDGTTITFSTSLNGYDFSNVYGSVARSTFISSVTNIGVMVDSNNNRLCTALWLHWSVT